MKNLLKTFLFVSLLFFPMNASAQIIRGPFAGVITVSEEISEFSVPLTFRLEDLVFLQLEGDLNYTEGVELEITMPAGIRHYRDALSFNFFKSVTPKPDANRMSYRGSHTFMTFIPDANRFFIRIPLAYGSELTPSGDTRVMDSPVLPEHFPLVLSLNPMMKGIPENLISMELKIRARPLIREEGSFTLNLSMESNAEPPEDIRMTVDGREFSWETASQQPVRLSTGKHDLMITSPLGHREIREIVILKGRNTPIEILLPSTAPRVIINGPESARIFLDGKPFEGILGNPFPLEHGEHFVEFTLGDHKITRHFILNRGETVRLSLKMEIILEK